MKRCVIVSIDNDLIDTVTGEGDWTLLGVFDFADTPQKVTVPLLGEDAHWQVWHQQQQDVKVLLAVDIPAIRKKLLPVYGADNVASFISRHAYVATSAALGKGHVVQRGADISGGVHIGDYTKIAMGATVHHDSTIGNFVTLAPGCRLLGNVTIGDEVYVGTGAVILPGITIGEGARIGAGAVVTHNIPPGVTAMGVPAHVKES